MANSKKFVVKNGLHTQNIEFVSEDGTETITLTLSDDGTLSFSGSSGQLFSITDSLTGSIFSVNDISGMPSIEVFDDGTVVFAETTGDVGIGTTSPTGKLQIHQDTLDTAALFISRYNNEDYALFQVGEVDTFGSSGSYGGSVVNASNRTLVLNTQDLTGSTIASANRADLAITSAGNVGVGTASPARKLDVAGDMAITSTFPRIFLVDTDDNSDFSIINANGYFSVYDDTAGAYRFRINSSGDVGIGTTFPSEKLHIDGNVRIEGDLTVNGSYTQIDTNTQTTEQWNVTNDGTGPAVTINQKGAQPIMDVQDDGTSAFYIEDGGNVGIGTTSPVSKLHINGGSSSSTHITLTNTASGLTSNDGFILGYQNDSNILWGKENIPTRFATNNSERMRISETGNVGIGTTTPREKLDVIGKIQISNGLTLRDNSIEQHLTNGNANVAVNYYGYANGHTQFRDFDIYNGKGGLIAQFDGSSSNVGIGTTNPAYKLDVAGAGQFLSDSSTQRVLYLKQNTAGTGNIIQFQGAAAQNVWEITGRDDNFYIYNNDLSKRAIYIEDSTNYIGINNITSPAYPLDVLGQIRAQDPSSAKIWSENTSTGQASLELKNSEGHFRTITDGGAYYVYDQTDSAYRFYINTSGNVGIGTSTPSRKLHLVNGDFYTSEKSDSVGAAVGYGGNSFQIRNGSTSEDLNFDVYNRTSSSWYTPLIIKNTGNVGIGTTSPGSKLDVNGDIQANRYYDRNDTAYYLDPASTSNLNDVTLDTLKQNNYYKKTITLSGPAANSGAGRWFVRLWQTSSGATFSGGKIRVGGTWNYTSIMGHIEIDYGVYAAANATGLSGSTRFSSGVANAYDNLRIGDIEIVNGYVGFYVWSGNTNSPYVHFDIYCTREPLFTYVAWASNSLPSQRPVEFEHGVDVTGDFAVTGNSLLGNGNGDYTHINDILYVGATDSGDSHIYFGENSSNWYGAHLYWDSGYGFSWNTRNGGTDTTLWDYATNDTSYWNIRRKTNFYGDIVLTGSATTTNQGRMIDFTGFDKEGTTDFSDRAYIQHTTNTGGHSGSVLVISSQNDASDGIAFQTNASSRLKHNSNNIFTDAYHPNADKWTTSRTLSLTGDVTGSVSWDGSGNASMTTTVANNSHQHSQLYEKSTITYGASYLQWTDQSGNGGAGTNGAAPGNPTNDWWHHIIMNHANNGGYYFDLASAFHSDSMYFRRNVNGSLQSWRQIFHDTYHPNADKWTTARTITLGGDLTGNVSIDGSANVTLSAQVTALDDKAEVTYTSGGTTSDVSTLNFSLSGSTLTITTS